MPVLTLEKPAVRSLSSTFQPALNAVRQPLRMPIWAIAGCVLIIAITAFSMGRHKPAHHYVSYFAYPMVLDTTTGKACYAAAPKSSGLAQDASFAIDGASDAPAGDPSIPMCGKD